MNCRQTWEQITCTQTHTRQQLIQTVIRISLLVLYSTLCDKCFITDSPWSDPRPDAAAQRTSQSGTVPDLHRARRRSLAPCLLLSAARTAVWTGPPSRRYRTPSWKQAPSRSPAGRRLNRTGGLLETPKETSRPYTELWRLPCWFYIKSHNAPGRGAFGFYRPE